MCRGALVLSPAGLAALVIPVNLPPEIYRLKDDPVASLISIMNMSPLEYKVDKHDDFLRTNDFTPHQAFGRSFAYR